MTKEEKIILKNITEKIYELESEIKHIKNDIMRLGSDNKSDDISWEYDEGNDEKALLNNIKHPEHETIGKIYYIQSYMNDNVTYAYTEGATIEQDVPYKVIGINHDGTSNTVDLMSCVAVNYLRWNDYHYSWEHGRYTTSKLYNWIGSTCQNGYSSNIQAKMVNMTERWREATGNSTGTLQTRSTKVKLLNPVELFGPSAATYDPEWECPSDHTTKFTTEDYGTQYPIWKNSTDELTSRRIFHNKNMTTDTWYWTNSWFTFSSSINYACCFAVNVFGSCLNNYVDSANGVAPVIRLSAGSSDWEYDEGNDESALLNNIKHPEEETIGKIYYIQSYANPGNMHRENTPNIEQNVPYKVIGINHDGTNNTVDLMSCISVKYLKWNDNCDNWQYGRYSKSKLYDWVGSTCQNGYSANIQAKMVNMTERWREATGNDTGVLQTRSTKCKLLNPIELFGSSAATYDAEWKYAGSSDHKTKFLSEDYGTQYPIWNNSRGALIRSRRIYHNSGMSDACYYWTNSWHAFDSLYSCASCFGVNSSGRCNNYNVSGVNAVAPVIRLSVDWQYDEGNDENALLNNIKHPERETIGKVYYIQSYINNGSRHVEGPPMIQQDVPYKVIGINHEGTTNTVDLQAMVSVNYIVWSSSYNSWKYGRYTTSKLYNWVGTTCQNGYSSNIQTKMVTMTERWREAISYTSGTLQTRSTKCKLLNPFELFGDNVATYDPEWEYASSSDHKIKFLYDDYGQHYSDAFPNSITADDSRVRYHDKAMRDRCVYWTNSWLAFSSSSNSARCFFVGTGGACNRKYAYDANGVMPVIRLSSE